jgi:hypothetical protein
MRHCQETEADSGSDSGDSRTAKVLAPEDLRVGDYVALLHVVWELPSFFWCGGIGTNRPEEPVCLPLMPNNGGVPYRVRSVCLPFVLVKSPTGAPRHLDVRRYRLARLDRAYARAAWRACKKKRRKSARTV